MIRKYKLYMLQGNLPVLMYVLTVLLASPSVAQVSIGGQPYSFGMSSRSTDQSISGIQMPAIDLQALLKEDETWEEEKRPWRFGKDMDANLNLSNSGTWKELPNGDKIWKLKISCPGAYSINLIYSDFYMPEGGLFYIYSLDTKHVIGGFTNENNREDRKFATAPVRGESCILEYYEPATQKGKGRISVSKVIHGYKNVFNKAAEIKNRAIEDFGDAAPCHVNINCPEGNSWQNEKRSVARVIVLEGTGLCSGSFVNNVNESQKPYFLTAEHNYISGDDLATWIFMFNYESPGCENIDGPMDQTATGCTFRATNINSDFLLVELSTIPPLDYHVYYNGWSNMSIHAEKSVCIHHPMGDVKKISTDNDPCVSDFWTLGIPDTHWRVGWDRGITQQGSSGSPLYDQNHRVIGQVSGGNSFCDENSNAGGYTYFGKFSLSWGGSPDPSKRLKDWLDPDNTGTQTLDGIYFCPPNSDLSIIIDSHYDNDYWALKSITAINTIDSNVKVKYIAGEFVSLKPGFSFKPGNTGVFTAKIKLMSCTVPTKTDPISKESDKEVIDSHNVKELIVSPNPVRNKISVIHPFEDDAKYLMEIYNVHGQLVKKDHFFNNNAELELGDLTDGIYAIHVLFPDNRRLSKMIVVRK